MPLLPLLFLLPWQMSIICNLPSCAGVCILLMEYDGDSEGKVMKVLDDSGCTFILSASDCVHASIYYRYIYLHCTRFVTYASPMQLVYCPNVMDRAHKVWFFCIFYFTILYSWSSIQKVWCHQHYSYHWLNFDFVISQYYLRESLCTSALLVAIANFGYYFATVYWSA